MLIYNVSTEVINYTLNSISASIRILTINLRKLSCQSLMLKQLIFTVCRSAKLD